MLEALRGHPLVKKVLAAGEERLGRVLGGLLGGKPPAPWDSLLGSARAAREAAERALRGALGAVNLPSAADVEDLKRRLGELETLIDALSARLQETQGGAAASGGQAAGGTRGGEADPGGEPDRGGEAEPGGEVR